MKEIIKKNKMVFIVSLMVVIIIILVLYFIFKDKVEYKDVIEYESFDKNSDKDYNKYSKRVNENRFDLKENNKEISVKYNEIKNFEQVNVVVNYGDKEIMRFESFNPITNVIKYKELFLIFFKENSGSNRESLIVVNKDGDKIGEIIARDERDIITLEGDRVINSKYVTDLEYPEVDENTGTGCGKKEIYRLNDHSVDLENYEYIYCLMDK